MQFQCKHLNTMTYRLLIIATALLLSFQAAARSPGQDALDTGTDNYREGDYEQARVYFRQATELDPGLTRAWENLAWAEYQLGELDLSIRLWEMVLKVEPDNISLLNAIGNAYSQQNKLDMAIDAFSRSLSLYSEQTTIHLQLGDIYARLGDLKNAKKQYRQANNSPQISENAALRFANILEKTGQRKEAIRFLVDLKHQQALTSLLGKKLAQLYAKNASIHLKAKRYAKAETLYKKSVKLDPDEELYGINLGWVFSKQHRNIDAISQWKKILDLNPSRYELFRNIGDAYFAENDKAKARYWYEKSAETGTDSPGVLLRLADDAFSKHNTAEASSWLLKLTKKHKLSKTWWLRIANAYQRHEYFNEGIEFLEKAKREYKKSSRSISRALARIYAARGTLHFDDQNIEQSINDLNRALKLDPANIAARRDIGWRYWRAERWDRVESHWRQLLADSKDKNLAHILLTQLYLRNKNTQAAIKHARASLKIKPDQPTQSLRLARALLMENKFEQTKKLAEQLAFDYPENIPIQFFLGGLLRKFQEYARAKQQWKNVLILDPDNSRAYYNYIRSAYDAGEFEFALNEARQYLDKNGPHPHLIRILADDAYVRGDHEEAIRWHTALVNIEPENPVRWLNLSQRYYGAQQFGKSISILKQALTIHTENMELQLALADVQRANGETRAAINRYRKIAKRNPGNRRAYSGLFYSLIEEKEFDNALVLLEKNRRGFLKNYEIAMETANILAVKASSPEAIDVFDKVIPLNNSTKIVPILVYHGLSNHDRSIDLNAELFEDQMASLKHARYTPVTLTQFHKMRLGGIPFPENPILITFDDARRDSFDFGDPALKKYGMNATMFVPTSRILNNHPYFADWNMIRTFYGTGRWDMQSHGHHAHDPLPIDPEGNTGSFLVNRAWLSDLSRLETKQEYTHRIIDDHEQSMHLLTNKISGIDIIGYAFPFSEAGQESTGNEPSAYETNELLSQNYFNYSFVQDSSGYNIVKLGESTPLLLRRFSVPRNWNGEKLIQHLAIFNPQNAARITKGQSLYWQGWPTLARNTFLDLDLREPDLAVKTKYLLASTSNSLGLSRDAARYIKELEMVKPTLNSNEFRLKNKINWDIAPHISLDNGRSQDSDEREKSWAMLKFNYPWQAPIDIWLTGGNKTLSQIGYPEIKVAQGGIGIAMQHNDNFRSSAQVITGSSEATLAPSSESLPNTITGWINTEYKIDTLKLNLSLARHDVDSVPAYLTETSMDTLSSKIVFWPTRPFSSSVFVRHSKYSDNNERNDFRAGLFYRILSGHAHWKIGIDTNYSDTDFETEFYYTPLELQINRLVLEYALLGKSRFPLNGSISTGQARDYLHAKRNITNAELKAIQMWTSRFKTQLEANYYEAPDYRSAMLQFSMQFRF